MTTIEEMQAVVAGITQEYINKASLEEKIKSSLDSIELCISEYADKGVRRFILHTICNESFSNETPPAKPAHAKPEALQATSIALPCP